ncbi:MAG: helix-turn-helix domain-containing protein [Gemmatimonadaceae bacterium]|nr:helix-turn-helix domain-containing protein [Gemmatimonadaceae bacterium]
MVNAARLTPSAGPAVPPSTLTLAEMERRHIAAALERTGWHQGRAAHELGISVKTLYRKIRAYGFERPGGRRS